VKKESNSSVAAIVGGIVFIVLLVAICFVCVKVSERRSRQGEQTDEYIMESAWEVATPTVEPYIPVTMREVEEEVIPIVTVTPTPTSAPTPTQEPIVEVELVDEALMSAIIRKSKAEWEAYFAIFFYNMREWKSMSYWYVFDEVKDYFDSEVKVRYIDSVRMTYDLEDINEDVSSLGELEEGLYVIKYDQDEIVGYIPYNEYCELYGEPDRRYLYEVKVVDEPKLTFKFEAKGSSIFVTVDNATSKEKTVYEMVCKNSKVVDIWEVEE